MSCVTPPVRCSSCASAPTRAPEDLRDENPGPRAPSVRRDIGGGLVATLLVAASVMGATRLSVGAGPWGGVYFFAGTALADLLNKHLPAVNAVAVPVTGGAHSLELLHR